MTGPEGLWTRLAFFRNPWYQLHYFLDQHGYQVERVKSTSQIKKQSHVFCSEETFSTLLPLISNEDTLTIVSSKKQNLTSPNIYQILYTPQIDVQFYSKMLDHCVALAEIDYLNS